LQLPLFEVERYYLIFIALFLTDECDKWDASSGGEEHDDDDLQSVRRGVSAFNRDVAPRLLPPSYVSEFTAAVSGSQEKTPEALVLVEESILLSLFPSACTNLTSCGNVCGQKLKRRISVRCILSYWYIDPMPCRPYEV
jgi:hypothetical protein